MKRCPECRRDYYDDTLLYCLDDGVKLLDGPASLLEPVTEILGDFAVDGAEHLAGTRLLSNVSAVVTEDRANAGSVAVLAFKNISSDAENEYFCDGLAEELLNALAKIDGLNVAARTSAFSFKNEKVDIGAIGRKLGVSHVVEGSVRKAGNRLRVSVQLLNAADGYHIWSETYDREMVDLFDLQDEITMSIVGALRLKLLGGEEKALLKRETDNTEAYKAYLKGRYLRYAKNDHRGAAAAYEEAVGLDPSHAPSWLGLAESYVLRAHYGMFVPREACSRAKEALEKARKIQGETAEAFYIEGFSAFIERDWRSCDEAYRHSLSMDPNNSRALGTYGIINSVLGRKDKAVELFQRSREADPLAAYPYAMTGGGLLILREPGECFPFLEQAMAFEKENSLALWTYSETCIALGKFDAGVESAENAVRATKRAGFLVALLGWALACAGKTDEAKAILAELSERPAGSPTLVHEACLLAVLGDKDAAFAMLSQAADELAPMACYVGLPCFDSLRDDPRFDAMVKRLSLPQ